MRKAGVLLPVFSLMSEYGIGDFGQGARYFIDYVREAGFKIWQILPITTIGAGNSPYSGLSAFAGNPLFIDLSELSSELLSKEEKDSFKVNSPYRVDYNLVKEKKGEALRLAYSRIGKETELEVEAFKKANAFWIEDYALFMAISEERGVEWQNWGDDLKFRKPSKIKAEKARLAQKLNYYYFEQYLFFKQWSELKAYANARGIEIFGDMPIYVSYNSPDVWANAEVFSLDEDLVPKEVAGVPPDYFAEDGQLWNNPLYDWERNEKDGFSWFVKRIEHSLKLYDILRIDHFRGLCEYWAVPAGSKTAKIGEWKKGPGMALWTAVSKKVKEPKIVAEDLGIIDEKVVDYLEKTGFPGMRVMQFAFDGDRNNVHLPYNYAKNTFAYSATHDNNTTLGWLYELDSETRRGILDFLEIGEHEWGIGGRYCKSTRAVIRMLMASSANVVIIPLQDLTGYGADTRINIPGEPDGNWEFRATMSTLDDVDVDFVRRSIGKYGR